MRILIKLPGSIRQRSHQRLVPILKSYGLSDWFIDRIEGMYENTASSVQISGHLAGPIRIRCSVRQGLPYEYGAVCPLPELPVQDFGEQATRNKDRSATSKHGGGRIRRLCMIDITPKCRALLLSRIWLQSKLLGKITAVWCKE
jgi:hypothetical protein